MFEEVHLTMFQLLQTHGLWKILGIIWSPLILVLTIMYLYNWKAKQIINIKIKRGR